MAIITAERFAGKALPELSRPFAIDIEGMGNLEEGSPKYPMGDLVVEGIEEERVECG